MNQKSSNNLLETFDNPNMENDFIIKIKIPEFTCLCPMTGQPDFAKMYLEYVPEKYCVELKSLKLYMASYREKGAYHEAVTGIIYGDLMEILSPRYLHFKSKFNVRGGIYTDVEFIHRNPDWKPTNKIKRSGIDNYSQNQNSEYNFSSFIKIRLMPRKKTQKEYGSLLEQFGMKPYKQKAREKYMSKLQQKHFRKLLLSWKEQLEIEAEETVKHLKTDSNNLADPNDRATHESEFGLELRTRDRERKLLRKIQVSLVKIDEGTYGYCEETGEEIGLKRLEARPVATYTLEAQERREITEKQFKDTR